MTLKSMVRKGNLIYWDTHRARWIDAIGPGVVKFIDDFVATPFDGADSPAAWTTTLVEAGAGETTIALDTAVQGGALLITTDAAEDDGANLQLKGESFQLTSTDHLYFGIRLKMSDATQSDLFVGLCITDTDILGGATDSIGFRKVDGSTTVSLVVEKDSTETTATALTLDTGWHTLEFFWDGSVVDFFVDGVALARPAQTNVPDDELLTPSIHFLAGAAAAKTLTIDWIRVIHLVN